MPRAISPAIGYQVDDDATAAELALLVTTTAANSTSDSRPRSSPVDLSFVIRQPGWPEHTLTHMHYSPSRLTPTGVDIGRDSLLSRHGEEVVSK